MDQSNESNTVQFRNDKRLASRMGLHDQFSANTYGWFRWVFDQLREDSSAHILELGCGTGRLWRENALRIPSEWRIAATDQAPGMLHEARHQLEGVHQVYHIDMVDAQHLTFPEQSFDAVVANHMLYYVEDLESALFEIRRVLRPGGHLYASTGGEGHLAELWQLVNSVDPVLSLSRSQLNVRFSLENGYTRLASTFSHVTCLSYSDSLEITTSEPVVAYVRSTLSDSSLVGIEDSLDMVSQRVQELIGTHGSFHVSKSLGLFVANAD